jgi:hypothetical protein
LEENSGNAHIFGPFQWEEVSPSTQVSSFCLQHHERRYNWENYGGPVCCIIPTLPYGQLLEVRKGMEV